MKELKRASSYGVLIDDFGAAMPSMAMAYSLF
jgi:hypothetical protein